MNEASFRGLLNTVFWIIVIYSVVRFLAKLFLPILAKKVVEKAGQQFQQQYQQNNPNDVNLKSDKPKEKNKVGEYIDYEEVD